MESNTGAVPDPRNDRPMSSLPYYQCHKKVMAVLIGKVAVHAHPDPNYDETAFEASEEFEGAHLFPADTKYSPIQVSADYYRKHKPFPGGYYVVYEDGYSSFSPAKAFEEGYTLYKPSLPRITVINPGHRYIAHNFERPVLGGVIQFIHKEPVEVGSAELKTISDGTTNEALLEILIDRYTYLQSKFPCKENAIALTNLQETLMWMEKRTSERKARGVEGKHLA